MRPEAWSLRVTLLGIGGAFDADRGVANTGALLEIEEAGNVAYRSLIDCGHTCGRQLHGLGLSYDDIDSVLLTHTHGDHMDGLELYGYRARFMHGSRALVISNPNVLETAWASLHPKMRWIKTVDGGAVEADCSDYFVARPAGRSGVLLAGGRLRASFHPVPHVPRDPAFGIVVELAPDQGLGPFLRWSGDTIFDPTSFLFENLETEQDLLFHEASFAPYYPRTVHTHFEDLRELTAEMRSRLVMIHHGWVEPKPAPMDRMTLGQPYQTFLLHPC